jgi:hypothetical protein
MVFWCSRPQQFRKEKAAETFSKQDIRDCDTSTPIHTDRGSTEDLADIPAPRSSLPFLDSDRCQSQP